MRRKNLLLMLLLALGVLVWNWCSSPEKAPLQSRQQTVGQPPQTREEAAPAAIQEPQTTTPVGIENQAPAIPQIAKFRDWAKSHLAAPRGQQAEMLKEGGQLTTAHTRQLAKMIRLDPEQAILNAVPMVIRQDLPESIVSLLDKRVRIKALIVNGNLPPPKQENDPDFKPYTRVVSTGDNQTWNALVYGKRGQQRILSSTCINGISLGYDMAVADSPVRQLETGERPVPDGREVVKSSPVSNVETAVARTDSGTLPPITAPPALETPERVVYICSGGHIQQIAEDYASEE
jgi:hypothetical protein